jgi:hypothetical protein
MRDILLLSPYLGLLQMTDEPNSFFIMSALCTWMEEDKVIPSTDSLIKHMHSFALDVVICHRNEYEC